MTEREPREPGTVWAEKVIALIDRLDHSGLPCALGGAIAMNYHREPRSTLDIDINIFLPPDGREAVLEQLADLTGIDADERARLSGAIERDGQVRALWDATHVDLFFADTEFHDSMAQRVEYRPFVDRQAPVLSIEDLLICKVLFDRPKDWVDIEAVVEHERGQLDVSYLASWLRRALPDDDPRVARLGELLG